jgi:hypothetical protein
MPGRNDCKVFSRDTGRHFTKIKNTGWSFDFAGFLIHEVPLWCSKISREKIHKEGRIGGHFRTPLLVVPSASLVPFVVHHAGTICTNRKEFL